MQPPPWLLPVGLAWLLAAGGMCAAGDNGVAAAPTETKRELTRLVRSDAARTAPPRPTPVEAPRDETGPMLVLEPFEVTTPRLPDLSSPPREDRIEKFFRTGTLLEFGPEKRRIRLWMKGDKGLMLTFPF